MNTESRHSGTTCEIDEKLDDQFVKILACIQKKYLIFNRHIQIRIEKWVEKLLQYDENTVWRKIRNNYICVLYEMVSKGKIEGIFLRMPPENDLPNFVDTQGKRVIQDCIFNQMVSTQNNHQISIKKIEEPQGDTASEVATPNCQTQRTESKTKSRVSCTINKNSKISRQKGDQISFQQKNLHISNKTMAKIVNLLSRHEEKIRQDREYQEIKKRLNQMVLNNTETVNNTFEVNEGLEQQQSAELRVEQGIQANKANLFQFGSPRGMTQMQYFKAALQL